MRKKIDAVDSKIIQLLRKDGRMPNTEIAKKTDVSEATVRNRLQRLIKDGIIDIFAVGDPEKLGFVISGNVMISIKGPMAKDVEKELQEINELWFISHTTGFADFNVEFHVKNQNDLDTLLNRINNIDGVVQTYTSIVRRYIRDSYVWWA